MDQNQIADHAAALRTRPAAQAAMRGTNAAVVGILSTALYNPVWTSAVLTPRVILHSPSAAFCCSPSG